MDAVRHNADLHTKYRMYFDLIHETIARFNIEASNTYNMDEKGFMLGILGRSKRIFDKKLQEKKKVTVAMQDREREFVTCLAAICADRSALPPGLIFAALGGLRDTWVEGIQAGLIPVNKSDFFPLFWQAWGSSFKEDTILKAWEATGIWPQDSERILKRFNHDSHDESEASEDSLAAIEGNFQRVQRLLRSAVKDPASNEARSLSLTMHKLQADKDMAKYKNEQL
ncbi:hypothetical protein L13192_12053 [Pyrenophora tritici-repentis]|nr:hypothetical protein L13192_12053 [Pyrenophora tritici-repentis]